MDPKSDFHSIGRASKAVNHSENVWRTQRHRHAIGSTTMPTIEDDGKEMEKATNDRNTEFAFVAKGNWKTISNDNWAFFTTPTLCASSRHVTCPNQQVDELPKP